MDVEALIKAGRPQDAYKAATVLVRDKPADARYRMLLYQLSCQLGQWDRALTQVAIAAEMDKAHLLPAQIARQAIEAEHQRAGVFAGTRLPMVFGKPAEWLGWLVQALQMTATGQHAQANELRARALEAAPASPGRVNGTAEFAWLADADSRFGPTLEAFIDGKYHLVPMMRLAAIKTEAPDALTDLVWLPSTLVFTNGGSSPALLPVRYPGSETSGDQAIIASRKTEWAQPSPDLSIGSGARLLAGDADDYALLEIRELTFDNPPDTDEAEGASIQGASRG